MNEPITFFVTGEPKGQPRPKATMRGKHAGVYNPGTADEWKAQVAIAAKDAMEGKAKIHHATRVRLQFFFRRPKGHYRSGKHSHILKDSAPEWHLGRPDCDNLEKAVLDALTTTGIWQDDSLVCDIRTTKKYAEGQTGCLIEISEP